MASNVKAETKAETFGDIYLSFSYNDKLKMLDLCELGDVLDSTSYDEKVNSCIFAYFFLDEKENKSATLHFRERHHLEKYRYLVKAGNYLYLKNVNNEVTEQISGLIYKAYNTECIRDRNNLFQTVHCENLLSYKGFDRARVRTSERLGDFYISK
jgi:hypothetical protein